MVVGIRHDPFAKAHPLAAEVAKPKAEQGYYLHPRLYGQPQTQGIAWAEMHRQAPPPRERKRSAQAASEDARAKSADAAAPQGRALNAAPVSFSQDARLAALACQKRKLASEVAQLQKSQAQMMAVVERLEHQSPKPTRLARLRF